MSKERRTTYVWPTLRAQNATALIDFYVEAFGFTVAQLHVDGDVVQHAELLWPLGGGIMIGSVRADDGSNDWTLSPGTFGAYVVTDDPAALEARALTAGATSLRPLEVTPYESLEFAVRDPEGNRWSFGTYRGGEPTP